MQVNGDGARQGGPTTSVVPSLDRSAGSDGVEPLRALRKDSLRARMGPFVAIGIGSVVILYGLGVITSHEVFVTAFTAVVAIGLSVFVVPWERLPKWLEIAPPLGFVILIAWIRESTSSGSATVALTPMYLFTLLGVAVHGTRPELAFSIAVVCALNFGIGLSRGFYEGELGYLALSATVWGAALVSVHAYVESTREGQRTLRRVLDTLPIGYAIVRERDLRIVYTNDAVESSLGAPDAPICGRAAELLLPVDERSGMKDRARTIVYGKSLLPTDRRVVRSNGEEVIVEATAIGIRFEDSSALGIVLRDVTEERHAAELEAEVRGRVELERARLDAILSAVRDGVVIIGTDGRGLYANAAYRNFFGVDSGRFPGYSREEFVEDASTLVEDPDTFRKAIASRADSRTPEVDTFVFVRPVRRVLRREIRPIELPGGPGFLIVWYDVTADHALIAERERQAETDPLTGLANRRGAITALTRETSRARRTSTPVSVALFDIDHFKKINDGHGHDVGDRVLVAFAALLRDEARITDTVARWGGEEFLAVLPGDRDAARAFCERIRCRLATLRIAPVEVVTISAGVTTINADESYEAALKRADQRLYEAKRSGRDRVV